MNLGGRRADTAWVTKQLLAGSLFAALAASLLGGTWFPLQAWWLAALALAGMWLVREARFYRGLIGALRAAGEVAVPDVRPELARLHDGPLAGPLADLGAPSDAEQAAFDSLQRAEEMVDLAEALNEGWIGEPTLAAANGAVARRIEGFRTTDDSLADLAEAWSIECAAERCAHVALQLHRERRS